MPARTEVKPREVREAPGAVGGSAGPRASVTPLADGEARAAMDRDWLRAVLAAAGVFALLWAVVWGLVVRRYNGPTTTPHGGPVRIDLSAPG
ncbi:MAG: hypothetical protein HY719_00045 [Planctomycetes bacterium]|nr:hypothetical protein [Planctomycetota bacterium]